MSPLRLSDMRLSDMYLSDMSDMHLSDIEAADLEPPDIDSILAYWYDSPVDYLRSIGVAPEKLPSKRKMREMLALKLGQPHVPPTILVVAAKGERVGVHELTHIEPGVSAVMHAHIWKAEHRGRGIGAVSYVKAMERFFDAHGFSRILFETPTANAGANRIKQILGIAPRGEGSLYLPIMVRPLATTRYAVERSELPAIVGRLEANAWNRRRSS
ncbi:GNAT family N-acetyltransferase [Pendulispora albinea]|uniref:GNAT family N-acetyltransferase n=1 Tax=Pendulispora albinea TaxID=2741071 RepID=A0ABZ2M4L1_9BACT